MRKQTFKIKSFLETPEGLIIEGYAVKYNEIDKYRDVFIFGCATKTITENKDNIKFLFEHDRRRVIGKIIELNDTEAGLLIKCQLSQAENDLQTKIKEGLYDSFSLGFFELQATPVYSKDGFLKENKIKEIKITEVSLVAFPAVEGAKFAITKSILDIENDFNDENEFKNKIKSLLENDDNHLNNKPIVSNEQKPIDYDYIIKNLN